MGNGDIFAAVFRPLAGRGFGNIVLPVPGLDDHGNFLSGPDLIRVQGCPKEISVCLFPVYSAAEKSPGAVRLLQKTVTLLFVALPIVFQPELRKALEDLGRKNFLSSIFAFDFSKESQEKNSERTINELVKACYEMGKVKTGALIVIENEILLTEYERTGIALDSLVSSQLLINIFEKNTPLHDGAIIVRGDRVVSATCYLPLSDNMELSKDLGTRHRAAVGISEVSDSLTIVVSEETGKVSLAVNGMLYRNVDADFLRSKLLFMNKHETDSSRLDMLKRRLKNVKKVR